ncbi:MAG: S-layer homology domain-containing protein [Oscillospiraceae bacterium]
MRRKLFSLFLCVCIILTLLPAAAMAADHTVHCICGSAGCSSHGGAQEWTGTATLPAGDGYYYLTDDVSIAETWVPADGTVLCLNGHNITFTGTSGAVIRLSNGQSFTLTDCHTGDEAGKVTGGKGYNNNGGAVYISNGTFTMYNGNLTGNTASYGGGVYLNQTYMQNAKFCLYGGSITGNTAAQLSGGAHIMEGTFEVAGSPVVSGNTAAKNNAHNVYLNNSVISVGSEGLSEGAQIDVTPTAKTAPNDEPPEIVEIANNCAADYSPYFSYSSDLIYAVQYDSESQQVQLKLQPYTVTFNMNGHGTQLEPIQVLPNRKLTKPDDPTEDGYEFRRWYETYDFMDYFGWGDVRIKSDTTLNARWVPEWNIDMTPQTYIYDGTVKAFEIKGNPTDFNYIWYYTYDEAEEKYVALENDDPTEPGSYMVRLIRYYDDDYPNPETDYASGSYDERFYDTLIIRTPIVTFDANGGTVESAPLSTGTDGKLAELPAPTRDGYTFDGWFTAAEGGDKITVETVFTGDTTLHAHWTAVPVTPVIPITPTYPPIVEDTDNGSVAISPQYPAQGDKVTITPKPEDGYETDEVIVSDKDGNPVEVLNNGDGTYTFVQPVGKVTVRVTFTDKTQISFVDVPTDAYYYDAVLWAVKNGVTTGTSATTFSPNATCTRAQTVTFLWRAAGCPAPKNSTMPFTDIAPDAYYYDAVLWAVENGITKGTNDTTFGPDEDCTRAQIVTFLWRFQGTLTAESDNPFKDVAADTYYADAVLWAVENGITTGTSAITFSPDEDCTRAQTVTFLWRCMK